MTPYRGTPTAPLRHSVDSQPMDSKLLPHNPAPCNALTRSAACRPGRNADMSEESESAPTYPEWTPNSRPYETGDRVTYRGKQYTCLQSHTSNHGWAPAEAFTLWAEAR
uniref:carbohydrate-binding protein n=1 Tax=Streptomyces polyasparticus TaxID=2767826 RepID=UPI0034D41B62